jgi:hydrogenase maturation protease
MSGASTAEAGAGRAGGATAIAHATIVVGLGNPVLGDDGAGWAVADAVEAALPPDSGVRVERLAVGGLTLMERLVGFRHAIVVDALLTGCEAPGTVRRMAIEDLPGREAGHVDSVHDASLADAIAAGRALGAAIPDRIDLVTIEAGRVLDLREDLTPDVAAAIPLAAGAVLALVDR